MFELIVDIHTILVVLGLGNLVTASLMAVYPADSLTRRPYNQFLGGKLLQALGWWLLVLYGGIPEPLSANLGYIILTGGMILEALAILSVESPRPNLTTYYLLHLAAFVIIFYLFARQTNQYIYISSLSSAVIFLLVAFFLPGEPHKSRLRSVLSVIYAANGLLLVARAVDALIDPNYGLLTNTLFQEVTFFMTFVVMIIGGISFLLLLRERTDRQLLDANRELEILAREDSLTGLANRRVFVEYLNHSIAESRRRSEPLTLIMIDIDFFKLYNDHFGHRQGDVCLLQVAQALKHACQRSTDLVSRYGGEEFTVVLLNTDREAACQFAQLLLECVQQLAIPHPASEISDRLTISLGVFSHLPQTDQDNYDRYMIAADRAMYEAKRAGRNRWVCA